MSDAPPTPDDLRSAEDRDCVSELRAWLMTYSGMIVSRRDAENLVEFLVASGWKQPE